MRCYYLIFLAFSICHYWVFKGLIVELPSSFKKPHDIAPLSPSALMALFDIPLFSKLNIIYSLFKKARSFSQDMHRMHRDHLNHVKFLPWGQIHATLLMH